MSGTSPNPDQPNDRDRIEQMQLEAMLVEARDAERAGVFGRTKLDIAAVVTDAAVDRRSWVARHRQALIGLPVAACLAFVAVLGTLEFGGGTTVDLAPIAQQNPIPPRVISDRPADLLLSCFTGPGQRPVSSECTAADYDGDGDIDLLDYGALQLAKATGPRQ